ncbi:hypothetical protein BDW72DRAFT_215161 [Aspergillus terricola var. indicus]
MSSTFIDPSLTPPDRLVLRELLKGDDAKDNSQTIRALEGFNDPKDVSFEPIVFQTWDTPQLRSHLPALVERCLLDPYIAWAQTVARYPTDVVMVTHLLLYTAVSVPSALYLHLCHFTWLHGITHYLLHVWFAGTYTLMKHQYVHQNGILAPRYRLLDKLFPYIVDPLTGHTWNSYYYHHVKHHHVEGNGPGDLSSTMPYDRDSVAHFAYYVARFFFLVWLDLPLYFLRKGQRTTAFKCAFWELTNYGALYTLLTHGNAPATVCTFLLPFLTLRLGLMASNWGQHAFVDPLSPESDFRSSVTLIDVSSNRFCFNDGYHTSHHLHPRRHWREHPAATLKDRKRYDAEGALVFKDIDFLGVTVRLLKDYEHLAKCLVPVGNWQRAMSLRERAEMLKARRRRFEMGGPRREGSRAE